MRTILSIVTIVFLSFSFSSCDKIDDPFPKDLGNSLTISAADSATLDINTEYIVDPSLNISTVTALLELIKSNTWGDTLKGPDNSTQRFIVLEEFTGHKCIFCPLGTREIIRLDGLLGDQLIPIAIHAGDFAKPEVGTNKYTTDFRPEGGHGETYLTTFNPGNAYPRGMVSRLGGTSKSANSWEPDINLIKNAVPLATIKLTNYYSSASNLLRINIEIIWQSSSSENYNLQVMVLEDHIIDWQKDMALEISNYDHRHVLRKVVNDTFGKSLKAAFAGSVEKIEYILPLDPNWKATDIESVVYIFNSDVTSYEVMQANAAYIE
jgi:hypothetical protein